MRRSQRRRCRVTCRHGQGRDHDRLQGGVRLWLRAGHRRGTGSLRQVGPWQSGEQEQAVGGNERHQRERHADQDRRLRLRQRHGAARRHRDEAPDGEAGRRRHDRAAVRRRGRDVANYAKTHPPKTFINGTAGSQDPTMQIAPRNQFRYHGDGAQWNAGIGEIAYKLNGWRKAAIIEDDYSFGWTSAAGMIADFCAVGGQIVKRVFPPLNTTDYAPFVRQLPPPNQVDGYFSTVGGTGTSAMLKAYEQAYGKINPKQWIGNLFFTFCRQDRRSEGDRLVRRRLRHRCRPEDAGRERLPGSAIRPAYPSGREARRQTASSTTTTTPRGRSSRARRRPGESLGRSGEAARRDAEDPRRRSRQGHPRLTARQSRTSTRSSHEAPTEDQLRRIGVVRNVDSRSAVFQRARPSPSRAAPSCQKPKLPWHDKIARWSTGCRKGR